ncbi:hypothetical protein [Kribbella sp. HUAS MG21]|uniref:Uncharacterized protein n=1 Tax=Kribbella sp. HUAS MG21 TaxID=3160966 RepID=A0AAU7T7Q2_9ACTN
MRIVVFEVQQLSMDDVAAGVTEGDDDLADNWRSPVGIDVQPDRIGRGRDAVGQQVPAQRLPFENVEKDQATDDRGLEAGVPGAFKRLNG